MEEKKEFMKRQTAYKMQVRQIIDGSYRKSENEPNYLLVDHRFKVSRVNMMGIIIEMNKDENLSYQSLDIDDSTGKISIRIFEGNELDGSAGLNIGDPVMIIGRPREYGKDVYIVPEIIKKIENKLWFKVRQIEIKKQDLGEITETVDIPEGDSRKEEVSSADSEEELLLDSEEEDSLDNPYEKYLLIIKELDRDDGAPAEEVISRIDKMGEEGERIVEKLLKEGEIFEIRAGKIKILG